MVRILKDQTFVQGKRYIEAAGLSTDEKPTSGVITGSRFLEVNTGFLYQYDEAGSQWCKVKALSEDIATAVDAWLDDHPEATTTVEDGAITYAKLNSTLQEVIDQVSVNTTALETKAEIDGYYEEMTVGDAEQLVATQYVADSSPYLFRTSGGTADIGNREYPQAIVGGSVAVNQQINNQATTDTRDGVTFTVSSGKVTVSGTAGSAITFALTTATTKVVKDHVYLLTGGHDDNVYIDNNITSSIASKVANGSIVKSAVTDSTCVFRIRVKNGTVISTAFSVYPMLIDLTQMFGSSIADYVYSLESATAGTGVAWLKQHGFLTKPYYAYNTGSLDHVTGLTSHDMVGFNQWDEEWEVGDINHTTGANTSSTSVIRSKNYIPCLPNTIYYFCNKSNIGSPYIHYYDANNNFISYTEVTRNTTFTTPNDAYYIRFNMDSGYGTTYGDNICINLHWSGYRDGEYEPYEKRTYALDSDLTLRGIPKLDAANNLYYDGDRYLPDGTVERRYGIYTVSSDTNVSVGTASSGAKYAAFSMQNVTMSEGNGKAVSNKYPQITAAPTPGNAGFRVVPAASTTTVFVFDERFTDSTTAKNTMISEGLEIVYILATPTTESADPYQSIQWCDDFGTEEFVTTGIPVGQETNYPANLRDKLQHLPDIAENDGTYLITQENDHMELTPYSAPTGLPAAPTTDGTYVLKATVADGTATYSWVSE